MGVLCLKIKMGSSPHLLTLISVIFFVCGSYGLGEQKSREPRIFYVSTTSSTSTLMTATVCFQSSDKAAVACGKRRKRRFVEADGKELDDIITPFKVPEFEDAEPAIETSKDMVANEGREGRFLLYWLTTTSLSTLTSYTTTYTVASLTCTPSSYGLSAC